MLTNLFRRKPANTEPEPQAVVISTGGKFEVEVRGESFHQQTISKLVGASGNAQTDDDRRRATLRVWLRPEPENPHDPNAVLVAALSGHPLGHLPRELCASYQDVLNEVGDRARIWCEACAFGRRVEGRWNYGIWLDLPSAAELRTVLNGISDRAVAEMKTTEGLRRTISR
jgi:HIRAN domain